MGGRQVGLRTVVRAVAIVLVGGAIAFLWLLHHDDGGSSSAELRAINLVGDRPSVHWPERVMSAKVHSALNSALIG